MRRLVGSENVVDVVVGCVDQPPVARTGKETRNRSVATHTLGRTASHQLIGPQPTDPLIH